MIQSLLDKLLIEKTSETIQKETVLCVIDDLAWAEELYQRFPDDPDVGIDLVCNWLRLKRIKPPLVEKYDVDKTVSSAENLIRLSSNDICKRACEGLDPIGWLEEANTLLESHLNMEMTKEEAVHVFTELFLDFDDCCLLFAAMSMFDEIDESYSNNLVRCRDFVRENPDVFLPARDEIIIRSSLIREKFEPEQIDLELTINHHWFTLEQLVNMETSFDELPIFQPDDLSALEKLTDPSPKNKFHRKAKSLVTELLATLLPTDSISFPRHIPLSIGSGSTPGKNRFIFENNWRLLDKEKSLGVVLKISYDTVTFSLISDEVDLLYFVGMIIEIQNNVGQCSFTDFRSAIDSHPGEDGIMVLQTRSGKLEPCFPE